MRIKELKKLTISALVLVMNNPSYDDDTRRNAEIEFRNRIKNLGYDINDFAHDELAVIMGRGYDFDDYLIGPSPDMQQAMQLYFTFHNQSDEKTLLFSETHICNDYDGKDGFFTSLCELEVANLERRMTYSSCNEAMIAAYNLLLERVLCVRKRRAAEKNNLDSILERRIYNYGNNMSDEEKEAINSSFVLRAKHALMERLNETVMQNRVAQYGYAAHLVQKDSSLLTKQRKLLYSQAKSGYEVDYNTDDMALALNLDK